MKSHDEIRAGWLALLLSTAPADRSATEAAVERVYTASGFPAPRHFLWFDSPYDAAWTMAPLIAPHHFLWAQNLAPGRLSREERERIDRARSTLGTRLRTTDWKDVLAAVGGPRGMSLQSPPVPSRILHTQFTFARMRLTPNAAALFTVPSDDDPLYRAESRLWGGNRGVLPSGLYAGITETIVGQSFVNDYPFYRMAEDEERVSGQETPDILRAAWDAARAGGMWWPFEHAVVLSERPAELHVNEQSLLHRADGPAAVFRDGTRVFAWNGKAVPEQWIMQPESVPAREYKGFDPTFRKHVESRGKPAAPRGAKKKATTQARALFERYMAGAHGEVWRELVALGPAVREDPHAAEASAVAHETMRRVESNVRTVVERLTAVGYTFGATSRAHVPPPADVHKRIVDFEKEFGILPLSLRAFYAVVGEVNLIGTHPAIAPRDGTIAPDPLVVYALDEGAVEYDDEDEEMPSAITIAPDDLHKANVSGGDAYEMAIPDLRADAELLNERHRLLFVDYLRLCFRFGGFPGYDGAERVPAQLASLSEGLIAF